MPTRALSALALLSAALLPSIALAQEESAPKLIYKAVTEITFTELEIQGELVRPPMVLVSDIKRQSFNFINLRTDFNEEMTQSVQEIR